MPKYGYAVVEGPHDVAFIARLLKPFDFRRVVKKKEKRKKKDDVDPSWHRLIPEKFPYQGDLLKRVPVPLFLQNETHSIAVHSAVGDTRLVETVEENVYEIGNLTGIGLIFDADSNPKKAAVYRYNKIKDELEKKGFTLPNEPGTAGTEKPRLGAFVLPDNLNPGTLEDLLVECAKNVYPGLLESALEHVQNASSDETLNSKDLKELKKPTGNNKAIVGSIASILRPSKSIAVSIQDNRWLKGDSLKIIRVRAVQRFLMDLFELNNPDEPE